MKKHLFLWIFATILSLASLALQQIMSGSYRESKTLEINQQTYRISLPKRFYAQLFQDFEIALPISDRTVSGKVYYRLQGATRWQSVNLVYESRAVNSLISNYLFKKYEEELLVASLPYQRINKQLEYYIELNSLDKNYSVFKEQAVKVQFLGYVPVALIVLHIVILLAALFVSNLIGIFTLFKEANYLHSMPFVAGGLLIGGILVVISQRLIWGDFFRLDLLIMGIFVSFVLWTLAFVLGRKQFENRIWILIAALLTFISYCIPHS